MLNPADLKDPDLLSKEQIEELLPILPELTNWADKLQAYALEQALKGECYEGYKVVEGRTNRKITDEKAAVKALVVAGYARKTLYERKLLGLSKLEALVGKAKFCKIVGDFVEKPKGAPVLVQDTDPRQPYQQSAEQDFAEPIEY